MKINLDLKEIPGFKDYAISETGEIFSIKSKMFIKQPMRKGYKTVTMVSDEKKPVTLSVHRLLMLTYNPIKNPDQMQVDHVDCNKLNNDLNNLEWVTKKENTHRAIKNGLYKEDRVAISDEVVNEIRKNFIPGQKGNRLALMEKFNLKKSMFYYIINDEFRIDLPLTKDINPYFNGTIIAAPKGRILTDENDKEITKLKEEGKTLQFIATKFNVSPQAIKAIIKKIQGRTC